MTTLQLNQKLFNELSVIAGDEDKMRQAVRILHIIASGKKVKPDHHLIASDDNEEMTDKQWADYFAGKPSVDLPKDTDTATFVKSCRKRTIKQMSQWL